ncbi:hypothetical protein MACH17_09280 [Phaeobacter inhibens]|nr:hypothetical protein MACH17_09280 [Phaeobacter inhibens]
MAFWYWYRQTTPKPPGAWVITGPYSSREDAMSSREFDKQDGQVGVPFQADTKEEAETKTVFQ